MLSLVPKGEEDSTMGYPTIKWEVKDVKGMEAIQAHPSEQEQAALDALFGREAPCTTVHVQQESVEPHRR
jgi:hypothetical protein